MNKSILVALCTSLIVVTTGCGGQTAKETGASNQAQTQPAQEQAKPAAADPEAEVKQKIEDAKKWALERVDGIMSKTEEMEKSIQAGDFAKAKEQWLPTQLEYEQGEALFATLSAELDETMDVSTETGFHGIEHILWGKKDPATEKDHLLKLTAMLKEDAGKLKKVVQDAPLNEQILFEAMTGILPELSGFVQAVYTGESVSGTRIEDARQVFEGVQHFYDAVSPKIVGKSKEMDDKVRAQIKQVENVMSEEKPKVETVDQEFGALFNLMVEAATTIGVKL
ncbi:imelysin family protein [Brevibacillus sp. SYSU BS000544]|uniref:imelysin family protein n=1 Tax=Brevibacillus sp. SYSU BS000544 TaxID=3416443 RepID=UPI003CE460A6